MPVIIADALISGESLTAFLPTSAAVSNLPPHRNQLTGLCQKIVVVSDNVALAFAGPMVNLLRIARAIRRDLNQKTHSFADIASYFDTKSPLFTGVGFVGFVVEQHDDEHIARGFSSTGAFISEVQGCGEVTAVGTGKDMLLEALSELSFEDFTYPSASQRATARVLMLFGLLLRAEHATGGGLVSDAQSGGVFQAVVFHQGRFRLITEVDDVTFVLGQVDMHTITQTAFALKHPFFLMRQFHEKGMEYATCARLDPSAISATSTYDVITHSIGRLDSIYQAISVPSTDSLNSKWTVELYLVVNGENTLGVISNVEYGSTRVAANVSEKGLLVSQDYAWIGQFLRRSFNLT